MSTIESPGSFNDFRTNHPGLDDPEVLNEYDQQLSAYRKILAEKHGLSEQDLHDGRINNLITLTMQTVEVEVA